MATYLLRAFFILTIIVSFFTTGVASAAVTCPSITRTLGYNSKGADVSALQTYLASDPAIYPEGVVSGFFGRATEKAVQRFQASRKIVSSGTAATTGYGSVGGKTRAALAACNTVSSTAPTSTPTTATVATTTVPATPSPTPTTQQNPLVTFADGATTTVTLGAGPAPMITTFSFAPRAVDLTNDPVTMYWITSGARSCTVEKLNGSTYEVVNPDAGVNGSVTYKITATPTTYSLNCMGLGDNSTSTASSIRRDVRVVINNPVPTCTVTTDKSSYIYAKDTIKVSWTSTGADSINWEHGTVKDPIALPFGNQYPTGSLFASSIAGDSQTIKLNVSGYGGSTSCTAAFSISSGI